MGYVLFPAFVDRMRLVKKFIDGLEHEVAVGGHVLRFFFFLLDGAIPSVSLRMEEKPDLRVLEWRRRGVPVSADVVIAENLIDGGRKCLVRSTHPRQERKVHSRSQLRHDSDSCDDRYALTQTG